MDIFRLHERLLGDYRDYAKSFIHIGDHRIREAVDREVDAGILWPDPLVQLNPFFRPGRSVPELCEEGILHPRAAEIFARKHPETGKVEGPFRLHRHQEDAIRKANEGIPYVLTTGTGSGKSLTYIIPAVDDVLRHGSGKGIRTIIVYPMNALANSQFKEMEKFIDLGFPSGGRLVRYARYTGQDDEKSRDQIREHPPDILLTNYVMLELMLTRPEEHPIVEHCRNLRFLALDELHTYRGRQGADVAMLVRRLRDRTSGDKLLCLGTSATMASGDPADRPKVVAKVAETLFGQSMSADQVIGETLEPVTSGFDAESPADVQLLTAAMGRSLEEIPRDPADFALDPVARWIETTLGVERLPNGDLQRARPRAVSGETGVHHDLATLTSTDPAVAERTIRDTLTVGCDIPLPNGNFNYFAFKIHQFVGRGEGVFCTVESTKTREIFLRGQKYVPGDRSRVLLPVAFCRDCGHPY